MVPERDQLAQAFADICLKAAIPVMEVYTAPFPVHAKADASPVTEADLRAEAVILEALQAILPGVPVLAEESYAAGLRPGIDGDFILVDPVDGTREFINRNGEFTINIALISGGLPVAGCVYAPALERLHAGGITALAASAKPGERLDSQRCERVQVRPLPDDRNRIAVVSRSHADTQTQAFLEANPVGHCIEAGSSLKFCVIAEGRADLYPRFGPTMEWDIAAGHAVLAAAGGSVRNPDGSAFLYGKTDTGYRNGPFIARGAG